VLASLKQHAFITYYHSADELLLNYPEFYFDESVRGTTDIWHDLEKKVTPQGKKNSLKYDIKDVMPLINTELWFLVDVANKVKNILHVVTAHRNKQLFLLVLEKMYEEEGQNITFNTGGGIKPEVRRVVMIYENEGCVSAKKRKPDGAPEEEEMPVVKVPKKESEEDEFKPFYSADYKLKSLYDEEELMTMELLEDIFREEPGNPKMVHSVSQFSFGCADVLQLDNDLACFDEDFDGLLFVY